MLNKKTLTIFTPTFNRAYILPELYKSLCAQTCQDFEWLIVDDGSEDNTEELLQEWSCEQKVQIRYYKQQNGGKQRAHNRGVEECDTELFVCVDSDDYVTDNFVETHLRKWDEVKNDNTVGGIISLQGHENGEPMGTYFPDGVQKSTLTELYSKLKFRGDATLLHRTELLKKYPFVVEEGEKFIGEGYVYYQIDQNYQLALLPEILMIKEYLDDGYTKNVRRLTKQNPKGYMRLKLQSIEYATTWRERFTHTILYLVGCRISGEKQPLKKLPYKWLGVLAYLPSWLAWVLIYKNA